MLTVAEGSALGAVVVDAHAARRRIVIPVKTELMTLVFMVLRFLIGLQDGINSCYEFRL